MSLLLVKPKEYLNILHSINSFKPFPLIKAVLVQMQKGQIFVNSAKSWTLIVHQFGFAQILPLKKKASVCPVIVQEIFEKKSIAAKKIRLYDVSKEWIDCLKKFNPKLFQQSERVKLVDSLKNFSTSRISPQVNFKPVSKENIDEVESTFGLELTKRFWIDQSSLLNYAISSVAYVDDKIASICYSCALVDSIAEIDVMTLEKFRKQGIGLMNVTNFIRICRDKGVVANWDCYSNNLASLGLAKKAGFTPNKFYAHVVV